MTGTSASLAPYYCTDCENHIRTLHNGRCGCGSGRVVAAPPQGDKALREVAIKPLEWDENGNNGAAMSPVGRYFVTKKLTRGWSWRLEVRGNDKWRGATSRDKAKAAAQADFETRIRAALSPSPDTSASGDPICRQCASGEPGIPEECTCPERRTASDGGELAELRAENERLRDDSQPMECEYDKMTAAENVLAWLLIEKVGCVDDVTYTPKEASDIIARKIDEANRLEAAEARLAAAPDTQGMVLVPREAVEPLAALPDGVKIVIYSERGFQQRELWPEEVNALRAALTSTAEKGEG